MHESHCVCQLYEIECTQLTMRTLYIKNEMLQLFK